MLNAAVPIPAVILAPEPPQPAAAIVVAVAMMIGAHVEKDDVQVVNPTPPLRPNLALLDPTSAELCRDNLTSPGQWMLSTCRID